MYLKKTLEIIGLSILICFSFIITEKTNSIMKENDSIMNSVKENKDALETKSVDAKINSDEIIPGLSSKTVDIEQSYKIMKKVGYYNENLYVYKEVEPNISIKDNYDKYVVSGNPNKKNVSIIFKIDNNQNIDEIVNLLDKNKIQGNFLITYEWASINLEKMKNMSLKGYNFSNGSTNEDSNLLNSLIQINTHQQNYYCYTEEKEDKLLENCSKNKQYTIIPSIIISNNLLSIIRKNITSGSIISISINKNTCLELANTLDYISSKGYNVVNLDTLLKE